jgi:glutamate 5-kinase
VVKVGTSTLTDAAGRLDGDYINTLAGQLSALRQSGKEIILVTSAAVSAGAERMGLKERPATIPGKQAAAAVGQGILMQLYEKSFAARGQIIGQILMTREDSVRRERYANLRNAFEALFSCGAIPIVNENDAVAVDELKIGDNDTLSAQVAGMADADLLVILSDIKGLYTNNPAKDPRARLLYEVPSITGGIEALAGGAGSKHGVGGMVTKIQAARIVVNSGISMVIADGREKDVLPRILAGESIGTFFVSRKNRLKLKKRWLAFGARARGILYVDGGCADALAKGSSLLPAGVTDCEGDYEAGATLSVCAAGGREIARGLSNYSAREVAAIKGAKSQEIEKLLGYKSFDEIIHRNNMVFIAGGKQDAYSGHDCVRSQSGQSGGGGFGGRFGGGEE